MRCILVGNYGVGNIGDEALKDYFLSTFLDIAWTPVSAKPSAGELYRLPTGARSLVRTPWWKTLNAMRTTDAVIFGGGSLFTDSESVLACILWFHHAWWAWFFRKPIFLVFQGVGPFRTGLGKALATWVLKRARFISVRDTASGRRIKAMNMNIRFVQSFDPIIYIMRSAEYKRSNSVLALIPRYNSGDTFIDAARMAIRHHHTLPIHILLMQPDDPQEQVFADKLQKTCGKRAEIIPVRTVRQLTTDVACAAAVVAERYHGALAALAEGVPLTIVSRAKGDKLDELSAFAEGKLSVNSLILLVHEGTAAMRQALGSLEKTKQNR